MQTYKGRTKKSYSSTQRRSVLTSLPGQAWRIQRSQLRSILECHQIQEKSAIEQSIDNRGQQSINLAHTVQAQPRNDRKGALEDENMQAGFQALQGKGRPLPKTDRAFFESRFGNDFSKVRLHSDTSTTRLARGINARAFTHGNNVVIAKNEYSPGSIDSRKLLAHELTHVLQQNGRQGSIRTPARKGLPLTLQSKPIASIQRWPFGVTSPGSRCISLYKNESGRARNVKCLEPYRRLLVLTAASVTASKKRYKVIIKSGPYKNKEGYIKSSLVKLIPTFKSTLVGKVKGAPLKPVRLVFFQNPGRLGKTIEQVGVARTIYKRTPFWVYRRNKKGQLLTPNKLRRIKIIGINPVYLRSNTKQNPAGVKGTFYHVNAKVRWRYRLPVPNSKQRIAYREGYVRTRHVKSDIAHRLGERRYFLNVARKLARKGGMQTIHIDTNKNCINEKLPMEYDYASDILNAIVAAAKCNDKIVKEIRIVTHGGSHGIAGTGDYKHMYGMYLRRYASSIGSKALTTRKFANRLKKFVNSGVHKGLNVYLHACSTADKFFVKTESKYISGFAAQLADELRKAGLSGAKVHGFKGSGPVEESKRRKFKKFP